MIKSKKLCALAMLLALSAPAVVHAATETDSISYGSMTANAFLKCDWSWSGLDRGNAKTDFTSSSSTNKGYKVTAYLEARDSNDNIKGTTKFDKGNQWAQCKISMQDVDSYGSTHTIANANNVYNPLDLTQLSDS